MKLLIVEDDKPVQIALKTGLLAGGFVVDLANNGETGRLMSLTNQYDLIILDLNLPDLDGTEIAQELRLNNRDVPIIILSGESEIANKTRLLDLGADDYMVKPFSISELIARIKAVLRRPKSILENIVIIKDIKIDFNKQTVSKRAKDLHLTRKELLILEYLLKHRNAVVSRLDLMENAWDSEVDQFSKSIETHILNIRKKINNRDRSYLIKTIPGQGYII